MHFYRFTQKVNSTLCEVLVFLLFLSMAPLSCIAKWQPHCLILTWTEFILFSRLVFTCNSYTWQIAMQLWQQKHFDDRLTPPLSIRKNYYWCFHKYLEDIRFERDIFNHRRMMKIFIQIRRFHFVGLSARNKGLISEKISFIRTVLFREHCWNSAPIFPI